MWPRCSHPDRPCGRFAGGSKRPLTRRSREDLFEYQGKQYFPLGIPVSPGGVAVTVDEAVEIADSVGYPVVVKAQVQVGGRGKAGGIKLANDAAEARQHAAAILGMDIKGHLVQRVWVEKPVTSPRSTTRRSPWTGRRRSTC